MLGVLPAQACHQGVPVGREHGQVAALAADFQPCKPLPPDAAGHGLAVFQRPSVAALAAGGVVGQQGGITAGVGLAGVLVVPSQPASAQGATPGQAPVLLAVAATGTGGGGAGSVYPSAPVQLPLLLGGVVLAVQAGAAAPVASVEVGGHGVAAPFGFGAPGQPAWVEAPLVLQAQACAVVQAVAPPHQLAEVGAPQPLARCVWCLQPGGGGFELGVVLCAAAGLAMPHVGLQQPQLLLPRPYGRPLQLPHRHQARLAAKRGGQRQGDVALRQREGEFAHGGGVVEVAVGHGRNGGAQTVSPALAVGRHGHRGLQGLAQGGGQVGVLVQLRQQLLGRRGIAQQVQGLGVLPLGGQVPGLQQQGAFQGFLCFVGSALGQPPGGQVAVVGGALQAVGLGGLELFGRQLGRAGPVSRYGACGVGCTGGMAGHTQCG